MSFISKPLGVCLTTSKGFCPYGRHVPNDAICTLTQLFCDSVSFVNDEVLVEDLEDLAARHVGHLAGMPMPLRTIAILIV